VIRDRQVQPKLVEQPSVGGNLVVPFGEFYQTLRVLRKTPRGMVGEAPPPVRFMPMVRTRSDTGG
jgi:protein-L-isoaspartate O-methyltransferase